MSQPFYFGSGRRRLFGIYTPPAARALGRGVVLFAPWGQEGLRAHRALRILADLLSHRGLHVLRFDYHGTGDSAGEGGDVSLAGFADDGATAASELRSMAGVRRVGFLGLRLGAAAATAAATRDRSVRGLALWDPVADGPDHLDELTRGSRPPEVDGAHREVDGFPLPEIFAREIGAIAPA